MRPGNAADSFDRVREKVEAADHRGIALGDIRPNPTQPRKFFDQERLRALAESIKQIGLLKDILVRPVPGGYELVLGERRWRASLLAGLDTISVKVVQLSDEEARRVSIVENVQRADLTTMEEAFAYKTLMDSGMGQADVGAAIGNMADRVAQRLRALSAEHYVEYQEERIRQLTAEVERLGARLEPGEARYDVRTGNADQLPGLLGEGFDLVTTLDGGRFVVRRRL